MLTEQLRLTHCTGREHVITVSVNRTPDRCELMAIYNHGNTGAQQGATIARWSASREPPVDGIDPGYVMIGDGRIDIELEHLRGLGLGSLLMQPLIRWIKSFPPSPVAPIDLSADDAPTPNAQAIRNRFYEKLGFEFDYKDGGTWGESRSMNSDRLTVPRFRLSEGWMVESISNTGSIFSERLDSAHE